MSFRLQLRRLQLNQNHQYSHLLIFRNEFLAVRNDEGGFFLCQAIQNVYKSSPRIRIRWLSEEKSNQGLYTLDFYDHTDIECVLTTVSLDKQSKGKFELAKTERERVQSILQKALDVEKGVVPRPNVTEENPDGRKWFLRKIYRNSCKRSSCLSFSYSWSIIVQKRISNRKEITGQTQGQWIKTDIGLCCQKKSVTNKGKIEWQR